MSEQRLRVQLREKDDIIRDQQEEIKRLRQRLIRLEIEKETIERKQEYVGKSTKKVYEAMEPIYQGVREKENWQDIRRYLKKKLSNEEGDLDEYKVREMMDYLNAKVFQVFGGVGKGRQTLIFVHDDDNEPFTLTVTKINKKGRYTTEQLLNNVAKAIDIHLHQNHGRISKKKTEGEETSPPSTTSISSSRGVLSDEEEELPVRKVTKSRWYRIDNNDCRDKQEEGSLSSCPECNNGRNTAGGWRRITNNNDFSSSDSN